MIFLVSLAVFLILVIGCQISILMDKDR